MSSDRIEKMKARLAGMNARNEELRVALEKRQDESTAMTQRHQASEASLEQQLANLRSTQAAERKAFDLETDAIKKRRAELKEDYADLHEIVGQAEKAAAENPPPDGA